MAIKKVTLMWSRDGGVFGCEGHDPAVQTYQMTEAYQVVCDPGDDAVDVVQANDGTTSIPLFGAVKMVGAAAAMYVNHKSPQRISPILWVVQVQYAGEYYPAGPSPGGGGQKPSGEQYKISFSTHRETVAIDRDRHNKPIVTVNNEPVEGLAMSIASRVITISRRYHSVDWDLVDDYLESVNSDTFLGYGPGRVWLESFDADREGEYMGPTQPLNVVAKLHVRKPRGGATDLQAWQLRWLHQGYYVKDGGMICRARDALGQERARPVMLKNDGAEETDPDSAVWKYTEIFDPMPFMSLGLIS